MYGCINRINLNKIIFLFFFFVLFNFSRTAPSGRNKFNFKPSGLYSNFGRNKKPTKQKGRPVPLFLVFKIKKRNSPSRPAAGPPSYILRAVGGRESKKKINFFILIPELFSYIDFLIIAKQVLTKIIFFFLSNDKFFHRFISVRDYFFKYF